MVRCCLKRFTILSPTRSDLIRNVAEGIEEPSSQTYVFDPVKSVSDSVPVRHKVDTTSAGILTSLAPLSMMKSKSILAVDQDWH